MPPTADQNYIEDKKPQSFFSLANIENELERLKEAFPYSRFDYQEEENQVTVDFIIDPCCYVAKEEKPTKYDIVRPPPDYCKEPVTGEYRISINLASSRVFELDKKIERLAAKQKKPLIDLHLYPTDKRCCLTLDVTRINWTFSGFFLKRVYPYFVWQAYYAKYDKIPPCGEYPHEEEGILEAIEDRIEAISEPVVKNIHRNNPCPSCDSEKKYKNCCLHEDQKKEKERLREIKALNDLKEKIRRKKGMQ